MTTDMKAIAPGAAEAYGRELNNGIDEITNGLNALCRSITSTTYGGKNAFRFKSDASTLANKLSADLYTAIEALGTNVAAYTSGLSGSLGGSGITISLKNNEITAADPGEDTEDGVASMSSLDTLKGQFTTSFDMINAGLDKLVTTFPEDTPKGWMGDKRKLTWDAVESFVTGAKTRCGTDETSLTTYVTAQVTSLDGQ